MPIGIYPPTLQSSQPAFLYTETSYPIRFTLQKITQFSEIGHVQIRVVKQSNNRSIANTAKYPDGTIYKTPAQIFTESNNLYSIAILSTDLAETWQPGCLYKVQMRFGTTAMFTNVGSFAAWKKQQIDNQTFSEWSTVMIIKPIHSPNTYIENAEAVSSSEITASERTEPTLTPLFFGVCNIDASDKEIVDKYKFDLYLGEKDLKSFENDPTVDLIESSGWLQHNAVVGSLDQHRFSTALTNNTAYTLFYSIQTVNGYVDIAKPYVFLAVRTYLEELKNVSLRIDSESTYCRENGCINIHISTKGSIPLSGAYVITRTSEKSNYEVWEDLRYVIYSAQQFNDTLIFQDFTIESGIKYKYAFQQENAEGLRTSPIYDSNNSEHLVNFEYSYLYHNGTQLRLMFNEKVSSFKHTTLTSKQDTLGNRYPKLSRNGYAYYAEFPISGLISFRMDEDQTFLQLKANGFYYKDQLAIPRSKFDEMDEDRRPCADGIPTDGTTGAVTNYNSLTINHNLTDNNIFVERKFREKVEQFLNDFNYKLYKSPTEGNIVVVLHNVSLTPNATLGRMIYDFSATAYEILDNTIENLDEVGIIDIGQFETLTSDEIILSFGQISGIYTTGSRNQNPDIYAQVKKQEEISIGGGYKLQLKRIRSFWVERYPSEESILNKDYEGQVVTAEQVRIREVCSAELARLNAILAQTKNEGKPTTEIEQQITECVNVQNKVQTGWLNSTIILAINGKNIIVAPHKIYSLTYPISSLEVVASDYPIIVNYICEMNQVEDQSAGVISAIDASRIWGQISGVFTETGEVIKNGYNYNYGEINKEPYRVYSNSKIGIIYDNNGNILIDNTNYNLYKTLNLYEIIKEETRKQVEVIYGITDGFHQDADGQWTSGNIKYNFSGIVAFDIEADPGTNLWIGKEEDGSDAIQVKIGESRRYSLTPMENLIRYIKLEDSAFAIVNYKCLTAQMRVRY